MSCTTGATDCANSFATGLSERPFSEIRPIAEEFAKIQKFDSELWGPVVKASGFKGE